ncbi:UDP-glucose 4-epimerase GalE [bacterium CG_4_9_14_3_um_filter_65_15]|nr:MAG: UDP-glucose 4-epimerase GalE [bacterium CG_4_9_14_3_um_filter_65_15]
MERLILVTGGAGYIGSHTSTELLAAGHPLVVLDNLSNSSPVSLDRVRALAPGPLTFIEGDMGDGELLDRLFAEHDIGAVVHFAGLKAVGESCRIPLRYYRNNITGTLGLLGAMDRAGCRNLIFSSSATVYGDPASLPITEDFPLSTTNPYGRTKLFIEEILRDVCAADPRWRAVLLRYFNPVGAHPSGRIGEDPRDIPNNLMPYIMQVAVGRRDALQVFGDDYDTPDGTGVRDYIHVTDLARGHVAALERLEELPGCTPINLGTGRGYSVLEVVRAAEKASGRFIPYTVVDRRPGDIAACWADPSLAEKLLGWRAELGIDRMCVDHWRWQSDNPEGFGSQGS